MQVASRGLCSGGQRRDGKVCSGKKAVDCPPSVCRETCSGALLQIFLICFRWGGFGEENGVSKDALA